MFSKPFSLNTSDFAKGALLAVIVAILGGLQQLFANHGFDFASWDWSLIINLAATSFIAYLGKNFTQDVNGTPFGKAK